MLTQEPITSEKAAWMMNPLQLAYIGDTVWDLLIRTKLIEKDYNVHKLHMLATAKVNAGAQATVLHMIHALLTPQEEALVKRGRNAKAKHSPPKNQNPEDYSMATGLEALFGYLYLTGQYARIEELFTYVITKEEQ
ncbi:MAG: Mini-ribonuclease 3 [Clostridiales bacterium]|nr:Mini-ribonuclease 3 [Clostridiales bacterium]